MYRVRRESTRRGPGLVFGLVMWAAVCFGCQSGPEVEPDASLAGKSDAEILYEAIVSVFDDRGLEVESTTRSPRSIVLESSARRVADRLRRRFTVRIGARPGKAYELNVQARHERRHGSGENAVWREAGGEAIAQRGDEAELKLARQIERRYREWKEYLDEHESEGAADSEKSSSPAESEAGE